MKYFRLSLLGTLSLLSCSSDLYAAGREIRTFKGAYIGMGFGWAHNQNQVNITHQANTFSSKRSKNSLPISIFMGGGATKKNKVYVGGEGFVQYDITGKGKIPDQLGDTLHTPSTVEKTFSLGAAAKLGYNLGNMMPYLSLGAVVTNWKVNFSAVQQGSSKFLPALIVGLGVGYQWGKNVVLSTEYHYQIYQKHKFNFTVGSQSIKAQSDPSVHDLRFKIAVIL